MLPMQAKIALEMSEILDQDAEFIYVSNISLNQATQPNTINLVNRFIE
jgi:hypothetical protein